VLDAVLFPERHAAALFGQGGALELHLALAPGEDLAEVVGPPGLGQGDDAVLVACGRDLRQLVRHAGAGLSKRGIRRLPDEAEISRGLGAAGFWGSGALEGFNY